MKRSLTLLGSGVAGALLVSVNAAAWDSPEHSAFGKFAIDTACSATPNAVACTSDNRQFAGDAVAAPDYCHSYWFSTVGIAVNPVNQGDRAGCGIRFGTPLPHPNATWQEYSYLLITNSNHFGDNTHTHWSLYHALAIQAAKLGYQASTLYKTAPDPSLTTPNPVIAQCTKTALGIEGFSLHYLTDRTAAGHAWDPEPRYADRSNIAMDSMRSCFHGQPLKNRIGGALLFDCVDGLTDSASASGHILQGLGDVGRNMGGSFAGMGLWQSDDAFDPSVTAQANAAQNPAASAFEEILATLNSGSGTDPTWTDTFISDHDFCEVALSECCRNSSVKGLLSTAGLGTCDTCEPDITDSKIKSACPVDQVVSGGVSGADWVPLQSDGHVYNSIYYAHLNFSNGGTGTSVAQSLARTGSLPTSTVHPDANWDKTNDVITLSGCSLFDITSANLPVAPLDGTSVKATVSYKGAPTFPVVVHWRPNTMASQGTVCKAPSGIPHLCDSQDFTISTAPSGAPSNPGPLTLDPWACKGASSSAPPATGQGFLYITDTNGEWTQAYPANLQCGGTDGGVVDAGKRDGSVTGKDGSLNGADGSLNGADGSLNGGDGSLNGADGSFSFDGSLPDGTSLDAAWDGSFDASDDGPVVKTEAGLIEGSCTHDVCTAGARLGQQCNQCTLVLCSHDPYCCDTLWGPSCFSSVKQYCGQSCP